jgi:anti-anti-sigma factor
MQGELDIASSAELQRQLLDSVAQHDEPLILDLAAVTFLDSSGLAVLYRTQQEADARGITLRLRAVPHHARRVLDVTGMTSLFELEPLDS